METSRPSRCNPPSAPAPLITHRTQSQGRLDHLDQIAVDPWQQLRGQFGHDDVAPKTSIDGAEFQADVSPSDHQQALGDIAQLQCLPRGEDVLAVDLNPWQV